MTEQTMDDLIFSRKQLHETLAEKEDTQKAIQNKIHFLEDAQEQLRNIHRKKQELYDYELYVTRGSHFQRSTYDELQQMEEDYEEGLRLFRTMLDSLQEDQQKLADEIQETEEQLSQNKKEMVECPK